MWQERLAQLVTTCHWIGAKGWAPATGGNMSVRQDDTWCWLSESGRDKGSLTTEDFLQVEIATNQAPSGRKPSAETGLHTLVYRLFPEANVVLHVHTVNATVLSRIEKSDTLALQGYEMQKTLSGQHSHLDTVPVAIFDNDQDIVQRSCVKSHSTPAADSNDSYFIWIHIFPNRKEINSSHKIFCINIRRCHESWIASTFPRKRRVKCNC